VAGRDDITDEVIDDPRSGWITIRPGATPNRSAIAEWSIINRQQRPEPLLVEPDILHARAVEDTVDRDRQPLHIGLPAASAAIVEDDRSGAVFCQLSFDLPYQLLTLSLIGLDRLLVNQLVHLSTAVTAEVQLRTAPVKQVEVLVGVWPATREIEADDVVLAHNLGQQVLVSTVSSSPSM